MPNLKFDFGSDTYALAQEINQNFQRVEEQDVFGENLTSQINGVNKHFTCANNIMVGTLRVYMDGLRLIPTVDYIIGTNTFTLLALDSPEVGVTLLVDYRIAY